MTENRPWPASSVEMVPIESLTPFAGNARTHTDTQIQTIADLMRRFGLPTMARPAMSRPKKSCASTDGASPGAQTGGPTLAHPASDRAAAASEATFAARLSSL